jgi:hypothetical protein
MCYLHCPIILKLDYFFIFPTHPEIRLRLINAHFSAGGFRPLTKPPINSVISQNFYKLLIVNYLTLFIGQSNYLADFGNLSWTYASSL